MVWIEREENIQLFVKLFAATVGGKQFNAELRRRTLLIGISPDYLIWSAAPEFALSCHEYLSEFEHDKVYWTILKFHPMWDGIHGLVK